MNDKDKKLLEISREYIKSRHYGAVAYCYATNTLILEMKPLVKSQIPPVYARDDIPIELYEALLVAPDFERFLCDKIDALGYGRRKLQ